MHDERTTWQRLCDAATCIMPPRPAYHPATYAARFGSGVPVLLSLVPIVVRLAPGGDTRCTGVSDSPARGVK